MNRIRLWWLTTRLKSPSAQWRASQKLIRANDLRALPGLFRVLTLHRTGHYDDKTAQEEFWINGAAYVVEELLKARASDPAAAEAITALTSMLTSCTATVQYRALTIMQAIREPRTIPSLATVVADGDPDLQCKALDVLASIETKAATDVLVQALRSPITRIRQKAATLLAAPGREAADALTTVLDDASDEVRKAALDGLLAVRDLRAVPVLIGLLDSQEWQSSNRALEALIPFGQHAAHALITFISTNERGFTWKHVPSNVLARLLGRFGDKRAIEPLVDRIRTGLSDGGATANALKDVASRVGPDRIVQSLIGVLSPKNAFQIAGVIAEIGGTRGREALQNLLTVDQVRAVKWLECPVEEYRRIYNIWSGLQKPIAQALANVGWEPSSLTIPERRATALVALERYAEAAAEGEVAILPLACALVADGGSGDRCKIIKELGMLCSPRALDVLLWSGGYAHRELTETRHLLLGPICDAVQKIASACGADCLVGALQHPEFGTRHVAAVALAALGWKPTTLDQSIRFYIGREDFDGVIRCGAPALSALANTLHKSWWHGPLAVPAIRAIGDIGGTEAITILRQHLRESTWADDFRVALECLLERDGQRARLDDLTVLAEQRDFTHVYDHENGESYRIDCSRIRQLAATELQRRTSLSTTP